METVGRLIKRGLCMLTILLFEREVVRAENTRINIGWQVKQSMNWFEQPWIWLASCLFLLLLVLVLQSSNRKGDHKR